MNKMRTKPLKTLHSMRRKATQMSVTQKGTNAGYNALQIRGIL